MLSSFCLVESAGGNPLTRPALDRSFAASPGPTIAGGLTMGVRAAVIALVLLHGWVAADEKDAKALTAETAAAKKIGEKVTVEMQVKSVGKGNGVFFLNSKENFRDADNFTVFINRDGAEKLKEAKIDDPVAHFKDKAVR